MTSRALAKKKVGRSDAREWSGIFYDEKVPLPPDGRRSHALDILLQFCPVLGAKPELRGKLKFREVDKLNLSFAEGRGGTKPIVMFPDSRRAEKMLGRLQAAHRDARALQTGPARSSGPATTTCRQELGAAAGAVFQSDGQHEPRLAAGADRALGVGDLERQRPDASGGGAGREDPRDLRPDRPAAVRTLSADGAEQLRRAGTRRAS
jgi:hypothetical protein